MIGTNLPGRVRNVSLAPSNGLMPLFDAVINSIHAIEEAGRAPDQGRIQIEIKRSAPRLARDQDDGSIQGDIDGFTVTDNGISFNEANYGRRRREQRHAPPPLEMGTAAVGEPHRPHDHRVPCPAGHE